MNNVYLLTGGNLGDRSGNLQQAAELIEKQVGSIVRKSSIYETAAWGLQDQPAFLNQVLQVSTPLSTTELLPVVLQIEQVLGRKRLQKMGPRIIDIDILFYNSEIVTTDNLTIPHPEIANRRFVLVPLNEIAPELMHPIVNKTVAELLIECKDELEVNMYNEI